MKVVILSGGTPPPTDLLMKELSDCEYLICADSGADFLFKENIVPDYLMGDFDSINKEALEFFRKSSTIVEKFPKDKDFTDTKLAFMKALELGASYITFLGCTGTRLDHSIGNIGVLLSCLEKGIAANIIDSNNKIFLTKSKASIFGNKGDTFSLFAYNETVENLCISGSKFNLNNYRLSIGDGLTISNEFSDEEVNITFTSGTLMVIESRD
jgi:thiamine pyrophosphokinase